jgi:hypothetical protein
MLARSLILTILAGTIVLGLGLPAPAGEGGNAPKDPPTVDAAKAKAAVDKFKRRFNTPDLDFQLEEVATLGKVHHVKVATQLMKLLKHKEPEIQVEAMKALGRQPCVRKQLGRRLVDYVDEKKHTPRFVAETIRTIDRLNLRNCEERVISVLYSKDDEVAITAVQLLGKWRSYKSLKSLLLLWEFYPKEGEFKTGTVTIHTGADAATERKLAKAAWKKKYGQFAKRPRPKLVRAIRATTNQIVGLDDEEKMLKQPPDLREWMSDNKTVMRKYR